MQTPEEANQPVINLLQIPRNLYSLRGLQLTSLQILH